jgi:phosphoglycolate phosphatase-like HAD superfamily hydrolase
LSESSEPLRPTLVMLDCDGVLFDSWEANVGFYDAILARLGLPLLDPAGRELAHRLSSAQLLEHFFATDPDTLRRASEIARGMDYSPFLPLMRPVRELRETLAWLRARGRTAMVTNRGSTIPEVLGHFELASFFDTVVGVHDAERPKPAPDMLEVCLARLGVLPEEAVYVGDSPGDFAAARGAGVSFIGVGAEVDCDRRIAELAQLPGLLEPTR